MKNAVLLAPYFLPRRRVGSWRPFKFAIHLREFGWQPHIITLTSPSGALTKKEARLLEGIDIYEISPPFDFTQSSGSQLSKSNGSSKSDDFFLQPALDWFDKQFPVDTWLPLFMLQRRKIARILRQIDPDVLWSTGDPWSSHWLGRKLARQLELPWVADFRDPWTLGGNQLKNRSDFAHSIDQKQEENVICNASTLTFTSHQTEVLYRQKYAPHIKDSATIPNSFDSTLFNSPETDEHYFSDDYLNLIFFGRFRPLSPAQHIINLLHKIVQKAPEIAKKIRIYSFGPLDRKEKKKAKECDVYENFIILKPIALENALPILTQADILWLSTHPLRKNIIPAKLWDYIAAKRPILSVAPNPEISQILKNTGTGVQFDVNDTTSLVSLLCKSVKAKTSGQPLPIPIAFDDHAIKQYDACIATQKLADIFDRLT